MENALNVSNILNILRVALYERVSTEEQVKYGYSIQTQKDTLEEHCKEKGYKIVGHYTDEGISGAKPPLKRPAMKKLLEDVKAGKIDVIIFTKLDRWFRSVAQYYKVQEILERCNVVWHAVLENYDTATADGRLKVNIMLSVAANERERTSERIKVVFKNKTKNKEVIFSATTLGYIVQEDENGKKRLVKDPATQHIMEEYWDMMIKHNNIYKTSLYLNNKYGLKRDMSTWGRLRTREIYTGVYKGIEGFCEPYVSREDWLLVNGRPNVKKAQKNRVYLFTGLIVCPECGRPLKSHSSKNKCGTEYRSYQCRSGINKLCDNRRKIGEMKIEQHLLEKLKSYIMVEIQTAEQPKPKPKTDVNKLKERQRKLNVMYMNGNLDDDEYLSQMNELKVLIDKAKQEIAETERDLTPLKEILKMDLIPTYEAMSEEDKRRFWRGIIKEIHIEDNEVKEVVFF